MGRGAAQAEALRESEERSHEQTQTSPTQHDKDPWWFGSIAGSSQH